MMGAGTSLGAWRLQGWLRSLERPVRPRDRTMLFALSHAVSDLIRIGLWQVNLRRPVRPRDRIPYVLFTSVFLVYSCLGELINEFGGFKGYNYFFNADCPRVLSDMARSHLGSTSGPAASAAHPLFVLFSNLPTAVLSRALGRSDQTAALLVCHGAAALAVVLFYLVLRQLNLSRSAATAGSLTYALASTELVAGSIIETYPFASAAILFGIWTALRSTSCVRNASVQILAYGMHLVLAAHTLLAAPALWLFRSPFRVFVRRTLAFWAVLAVLGVGLFSLQRRLYPDTDVTKESHYAGFMPWFHPPKTVKEAKEAATRLAPHVLVYNVVAPTPRFSGEPERLTTFMWYPGQERPHFTRLGQVTAAGWLLAGLIATWQNLRHIRRVTAQHRGVAFLCLGWLLGVTGVFMMYGDDYLLYASLWTGHVVLWVWIGLSLWAARTRNQWIPKALVCTFLAMLAANNADFVHRMLRHYHSAALVTW